VWKCTCGIKWGCMNESCLIWISHVSYEWVMSHMNESCLIWMSHVSYEWVMSHMNESCLICMSHVSYEWVISRVYTSPHYMLHYTLPVYIQICGSAPVVSSEGVWMSHVSHEWVMSRMNMLSQYTSHNALLVCTQVCGSAPVVSRIRHDECLLMLYARLETRRIRYVTWLIDMRHDSLTPVWCLGVNMTKAC